jgi:hypothetical protein
VCAAEQIPHPACTPRCSIWAPESHAVSGALSASRGINLPPTCPQQNADGAGWSRRNHKGGSETHPFAAASALLTHFEARRQHTARRRLFELFEMNEIASDLVSTELIE